MMRFLGALLVAASWIVFLFFGMGALMAGWLYHGYNKLDCHPMFAQSDSTCSTLNIWASENAMTAERGLMPYQQVLSEDHNLLIASAISVFAGALLIQVVHRLSVRRRKRHLGVFADVRGFRPIDL